MTIGIVTNIAPAMISPNGSCLAIFPVNNEMATGIVLACVSILVKVKANKYSFQAAIKAKSPVVTIAGAVSGINI